MATVPYAAMVMLLLLLVRSPATTTTTAALLGDGISGVRCHDQCRANCNGWGFVCHLSCSGACAGSDGIGIMSIDNPTTIASSATAPATPQLRGIFSGTGSS